jgi:hypothetical protein
MFGMAAALCVCGLFMACQSTKGANASADKATAWAIDPGKSIIQTDILGFSPMAESGRNKIVFSLYFANAADIKKWVITIADVKGKKCEELSGNALYLPSSIAWDGKDASGKYAAEGTYVADLTVDYGNAYSGSVSKSTAFILDTTRPSGMISFSPVLFSPMNDTDRISLTITPDKDLARIDSWGMEIFDPAWNLFKAFTQKWPADTVVWDGRGINGELVVSAEDYPVIVKLRDEFGNVGIIETKIPVDILVIKDGDNYRIENSRIYFNDFTADYENVPANLSQQNILRLDQLAEKLKKFPDHKIVIVGHAVSVFWEDPEHSQTEQAEVLIPLSKARAEAIKKAMVTRGINPDVITTEGVGDADPLVPDSDYANRWKNRRTAIFLVK